ncbi:hypothetical protein [Sinomonas mesophila]|nr:hypothetical protein [Sinomonas mesophila]
MDYPKRFGQFQDWFSTDDACVEYLAKLLSLLRHAQVMKTERDGEPATG